MGTVKMMISFIRGIIFANQCKPNRGGYTYAFWSGDNHMEVSSVAFVWNS